MQPQASTATLPRPLPPPPVRPYPAPPRTSITTQSFSLNSANYLASRHGNVVRGGGNDGGGKRDKAMEVERRIMRMNSVSGVDGREKGKGKAKEGVRELPRDVGIVSSSSSTVRRPFPAEKDRTMLDKSSAKSVTAPRGLSSEQQSTFDKLSFHPPPPRLPFPAAGNTTYPSVAYYRSSIVPAASTPRTYNVGEPSTKSTEKIPVVGRSRSFSLLHSPVRPTTISNEMAEQEWEKDRDFLESTDEEDNEEEEVSRRLVGNVNGSGSGSVSVSARECLSSTTTRRNSSGRFSVASAQPSSPPRSIIPPPTTKPIPISRGDVEKEPPKKKRKRDAAKSTKPLELKKLMFVGAGPSNFPVHPPSLLATPLTTIAGTEKKQKMGGKLELAVRKSSDGIDGLVPRNVEKDGGGKEGGREVGQKRSSNRQPRFDYYTPKPPHSSTTPQFPQHPSTHPLPFSHSPPSIRPPKKKPKLVPVKSEEELERKAIDDHWSFLKVERGPKLDLEWEKGWKEGGVEEFACGSVERGGEILGRIVEVSLVSDDILPVPYDSSTNPTRPIRSNSQNQIITLLSLSISKSSISHGPAPIGFSWVTKEESFAHGRRGKVVGWVERELEEGGYGRMWETKDYVQSERWVDAVVGGKGKGKAREKNL